ncbi:MAG: glycosyltransferase family 25 protein [Pseudomonadota bacterium]
MSKTMPITAVSMYFEGRVNIPIFVVHAPSLSERKAHITNELIGAGLSWQWVTEYAADDISTDVDLQWFAPGNHLSLGQKSCAMKHVTAMQQIVENGFDVAIILEDDVILAPNFVARLKLVISESQEWPRPFVINLGSASNFYTPASHLKTGKILYRGTKNRNAEAYLLGSQEAALRLKWIAKHKLSDPIDITYNSTDASLGIEIIWTEPPLAEQGSLTGLFQSSLDPKMRSAHVLKFQFPVQKFRRRYLKRWAYAVITKIKSSFNRRSPGKDEK